MVFLLKLMAVPLYPLGFGLTVIIVGLVMIKSRRRYGMSVAVVGIAILYLLSTPVVSRVLVRMFEASYYSTTPFPDDCQAIVVLGGGGMPLIAPRSELEVNDAGDRLLHAARLFKREAAPRIVTSGGKYVGAFFKCIPEGEHNARLLQELGIDRSAIVAEKQARTTAEHGPYIAAIFDSLGIKKMIILVTSAAHMYRSVRVFRKYGFTVFPAATDFQSGGGMVNSIRDFFPDAGALKDVTGVFHEFYGIFGYVVLGRM